MEMVNLALLEDGPFVVEEREAGKGKAVYTNESFGRGNLVSRFGGTVLPYRTQHTLQINNGLHLLDLSFLGFLAHSCSPNVFVDMVNFELWALEDIEAGSALTMDYASTEDILFKQFRCLCGAPNCRKIVTGRKELVDNDLLDELREDCTLTCV
jgi:hypothetical protein